MSSRYDISQGTHSGSRAREGREFSTTGEPRAFLQRLRAGFLSAGLACFFCSAPYPHAGEPAPSIASDRPGLADGAWVLAPGVWQIEIGGRLREFDATRGRETSALLRHGVGELELRVYLPSPVSTRVDNNSWSDAQWSDLGLGVKLPLGSAADWDWSVVAAATMPTGSSGVTADAVTGFATLVGETRLSDELAFSLNAGASASAESSEGSSLSLIPTLTLSLSDRMSIYGGYAGFYGPGDDQHWLEAGVVTVAGRHFQWDINSAYDTQSGDWFFGLGFSRRWLP